jgi:hypothetical protein
MAELKNTPKASKTRNGQRIKRPKSEKTKFPQGQIFKRPNKETPNAKKAKFKNYTKTKIK